MSVISSGNSLPDAITLTAANTDPNGPIDQLEKYEGMRVQVSSLTVIAPTQGTVNEANATSASNGVFYGVITGIARARIVATRWRSAFARSSAVSEPTCATPNTVGPSASGTPYAVRTLSPPTRSAG